MTTTTPAIDAPASATEDDRKMLILVWSSGDIWRLRELVAEACQQNTFPRIEEATTWEQFATLMKLIGESIGEKVHAVIFFNRTGSASDHFHHLGKVFESLDGPSSDELFHSLHEMFCELDLFGWDIDALREVDLNTLGGMMMEFALRMWKLPTERQLELWEKYSPILFRDKFVLMCKTIVVKSWDTIFELRQWGWMDAILDYWWSWVGYSVLHMFQGQYAHSIDTWADWRVAAIHEIWDKLGLQWDEEN